MIPKIGKGSGKVSIGSGSKNRKVALSENEVAATHAARRPLTREQVESRLENKKLEKEKLEREISEREGRKENLDLSKEFQRLKWIDIERQINSRWKKLNSLRPEIEELQTKQRKYSEKKKKGLFGRKRK